MRYFLQRVTINVNLHHLSSGEFIVLLSLLISQSECTYVNVVFVRSLSIIPEQVFHDVRRSVIIRLLSLGCGVGEFPARFFPDCKTNEREGGLYQPISISYISPSTQTV
jgi:hypothetical protein